MQDKEKKEKENRRRQEFEYKLLYQSTLHESKSAWETSNIFLTSNSIIAGFIALILTEDIPNKDAKLILSVLIIFGLLVSISWKFATNRIIKIYKYRRDNQAGSLEGDLEIHIFSGEVKKLASGLTTSDGVRLGGLKSFDLLNFVICLFIFLYLIFFVITFKENIQNFINCL